MVIFHNYVKLPEGKHTTYWNGDWGMVNMISTSQRWQNGHWPSAVIGSKKHHGLTEQIYEQRILGISYIYILLCVIIYIYIHVYKYIYYRMPSGNSTWLKKCNL